MAWEVEYTDEFEQWWNTLSEEIQDSVAVAVHLLEARGPLLPFPHSSAVRSSRHDRMRELRIQHAGSPYRVLYVFDSRRVAILLLGGVKRGGNRWYVTAIPRADRLYDEHLRTLLREEDSND